MSNSDQVTNAASGGQLSTKSQILETGASVAQVNLFRSLVTLILNTF